MDDEAKTADGRRRWRQWTEAEARAALTKLSESGLSMARFAQNTGISIRRLTYWRGRLAETGPAGFVAVSVPQSRTSSLPADRRHIEIAVDGGVTVRVREDLDVEQLSRIVTAFVRRPQGC